MSGALLNAEAERKEDQMKDEKKSAGESRLTAATLELVCDHPGCHFEATNWAGLTNHQCQKHAPAIIVQSEHCRKPFNRQGLHNHKWLCSRRQPQ